MASPGLSTGWTFWRCAYWLFWAIAFAVWEIWAGVEKKHDIPMLTQAVCRYVPWWVTLPLLSWGIFHFATRYFSKTYMAGLGK